MFRGKIFSLALTTMMIFTSCIGSSPAPAKTTESSILRSFDERNTYVRDIEFIDISAEDAEDAEYVIEAEPIITQAAPEPVEEIVEVETVQAEPEPVEPVYEMILTEEEIELIALVTMAEAEGECEEGKRLVIDTILNRVDSEYFPNTVTEVIYQPDQFTSMWNGRVDVCYVQEEICELVREELQSRVNYEVMFFTAHHYGKFGVPMFSVENHYFSSYN